MRFVAQLFPGVAQHLDCLVVHPGGSRIHVVGKNGLAHVLVELAIFLLALPQRLLGDFLLSDIDTDVCYRDDIPELIADGAGGNIRIQQLPVFLYQAVLAFYDLFAFEDFRQVIDSVLEIVRVKDAKLQEGPAHDLVPDVADLLEGYGVDVDYDAIRIQCVYRLAQMVVQESVALLALLKRRVKDERPPPGR